MKFVTLFLKTENVHLLKDVGMIPYFLYKNHNIDAHIATYNNSEYTYIDNEVSGLKLDFVSKSPLGKIMDGIRYILKHGKKIDILNIYHLNLSSYFYEIAYRLVNPHGIIYLKLDMNPIGFINCFKHDPRGLIKRLTIKRCSIASVETTIMRDKLQKHFGNKIIYIPNGCYLNEDKMHTQGSPKENLILTVGNLGTKEKATDVLLEAFAIYKMHNQASDWKLKLIGKITDDFKESINEYFKKYPLLKNDVIFTGAISDKELLTKEYAHAKIFTLPSLSESFGIVLVEAAANGCYLITSDMVPAGYDISDCYKYGEAVKAGNVNELAMAFENATANINFEKIEKGISEHARNAFDWNKITSQLNNKLKSMVAK